MDSLVVNMTEVWESIMTFIRTAFSDMQLVFVAADGSLSFLGVLAIISVGIGIAFLIMGVIQNFLHLRS